MLIKLLAMLTFLSPWWAAGAVLAVGLPLLAHLLSKSRYREVLFPATRLVREAVQQTTRIERPRHRLLMLLRWLLLLLVVVAFMRPRWLPEAEARNAERGVTLIIMIDASASMLRVQDGATLYERAQRTAEDLLDDLDPSRDAATIVRVGRDARPLLPEPTADRGLLREALTQSRPTYESADWTRAVGVAHRLAGQSGRATRTIILSDQQGDGPIFRTTDNTRSNAVIHHMKIDGPADNTAVRLIDINPYPPIAGQPLTVTVEAAHFGEKPRIMRLNATLGGAQMQSMLALGPGSSRRMELQLPAGHAGKKFLKIGFDGSDALSFDDAAGRFLEVQRGSEVLVIHGETADARQLAGRVADALNPGDLAGSGLPRARLASADKAESQFESADPAKLRTVVLLSPKLLDDQLGEALHAYLARGGGVVAFAADARYAVEQGALPMPLRRTENRRLFAMDLPATRIDFTLQPLRIFEGPARAGLASLVWPGVDPVAFSDDAERLLGGENGRAIVSAESYGRGRLIAINADLSTGPGGLLAEPAFVVLFNELCRYASPGPALPPPARPGDVLPAVLRNASSMTMPDGADADATQLTAPGNYRAMDREGQFVGGVWAELDPAESDPRIGENWSDWGGGDASPAAKNSAADPASLATDRTPPIELWPYLVLGALLLVGGESLLLWRFASAKGGGA